MSLVWLQRLLYVSVLAVCLFANCLAIEGMCESSKFNYFKYPKVAHAINLGAATPDDKISKEEAIMKEIVNGNTYVEVEEKLDGINHSIRVLSNGTILMKNKSGKSVADGPEAAAMTAWINRHQADIHKVLRPCRDVLIGEWLYLTHKIRYTTLPGWFVAFDIYDTKKSHFENRSNFKFQLRQTKIPITEAIYQGVIRSMDELRSFANGPSAYGPLREGAVFRTFTNDGKTRIIVKIVSSFRE